MLAPVVARPVATMTEERCHNCGAPAIGEVATGPPEHRWRYWCRRCLLEYRDRVAERQP